MRNAGALHNEVDDAEEAFAEDEALSPAPVSATNPSADPRRRSGDGERTEASTISGVSPHPRRRLQYHANRPPKVRLKVKEGVLYMPMATAMPPGTSGHHRLLAAYILTAVRAPNRRPKPMANSLASLGRPFPVTSLAVNIHT